jgi:hypothetical protein
VNCSDTCIGVSPRTGWASARSSQSGGIGTQVVAAQAADPHPTGDVDRDENGREHPKTTWHLSHCSLPWNKDHP